MDKTSENKKMILLKSLCNSDILKYKQPIIIKNDTTLLLQDTLTINEYLFISSSAENFNLKLELNYNGTHTKIIFIENDNI